jgi:hypothetical protein
MAGDKHSLPRYPEGATIWFKGKTWNQVAEMLESWRVRPGKGIRLEQFPTGTIISSLAEATPAGAAADPGALTLSLTRPAIHGAPVSGPASGNVRVWFTFGTWNQRLPQNSVWYLDVSASADRYFFAKATLSPLSDRLTLAEWEIVSGAAEDSEVTADWGAAGELPETLVLMLGTYDGDTGQVASTGKGSIYTRDHLSNVITDAGTTAFTRNIDFVRH